jgi:hypothetical protein
MMKSKIRNSKSETNPKPKAQMTETLAPAGRLVLNFGFWIFEFVSDLIPRFGFQAVLWN